MKKKTSIALFLVSIITQFSCSNYLIKDNELLSKLSKAGIIFRISKSSKISKDEIIKNTQYWLSNYRKEKDITIITETSESIGYFKYPHERFFQLSNENNFLKYKSIGVLNLYLQNNRKELLNILSTNNLDSLIIFEIYSIISTEMQFFDYDTVLAVVDSNLNIAYLDSQTSHIDSESSNLEELKNQTMDKINQNLIEDLQELDFLSKRIEISSNNLISKKEQNPSLDSLNKKNN